MGNDGIKLEKIKEIKRSKTIETEKSGSKPESLLLGSGGPTVPEIQKKDSSSEEKEKKFENRVPELISVSEGIEVKKPKSKPGKTLTRTQVKQMEAAERQAATRELERVQTILEEEETAVFGKDVRNVQRVKYASLRTGAKKKRVDSAVKRRKNAAMLSEIERRLSERPAEIEDIDQDTFLSNLKAFLKLSGDPYQMDTDEDFVKNYEKNYILCETAEKMSKWVSDAVEGGYFPKKTDLAEVQAKILRYQEMKEYMDTHSALL